MISTWLLEILFVFLIVILPMRVAIWATRKLTIEKMIETEEILSRVRLVVALAICAGALAFGIFNAWFLIGVIVGIWNGGLGIVSTGLLVIDGIALLALSKYGITLVNVGWVLLTWFAKGSALLEE